ncbi:hypothetical protein SAMN05660350_03500 [Geodermatophilus obscurus]|uniref:Uncharacterized protein n=1 Tax=Geodermatophilus obscurus TaxID=1861 RepID=A0A1M7ULW2_9ACTN|nr:hypothetical protein SAMN05660350_03500 [Geodermatophilus obscurus]
MEVCLWPPSVEAPARPLPLPAGRLTIPPRRPGRVVRFRLHDLLPAHVAALVSEWAHDPAEQRIVVRVSLDGTDDDEPSRSGCTS